MAEKETAAATGTVTAIGTTATVAGVFRAFRKGAATVIEAATAAGEKTTIIAVRVSKKSGATSFNKKEKYI